MRLTIDVPHEGNVSLRTQTSDFDPNIIKRQLQKARDAIDAELKAFNSCPIHNAKDGPAKARYNRHVSNAGIHCNRFPAWEELTEAQRDTWRRPEDDQ